MDVTHLNSVALRIFLVLWTGMMGVFAVVFYGQQIFAPLAVKFMATETAMAKSSNRGFFNLQAEGPFLVDAPIQYAGHSGKLQLVFPVETGSGRDLSGYEFKESDLLPGLGELTIPVIYVRAWPSLVLRDLPNGSVWLHYRDSCRLRDLFEFIAILLLAFGAAYWFYRDVKKRRQEYRR